MAASSTPPDSAALPTMGTVWERLGTEKLSSVSQALGKDESWARKVRNKECGVLVDEIPRLLAALNLKIVDKSKVCVDREVYAAYEALARKAINTSRTLDWTDDE